MSTAFRQFRRHSTAQGRFKDLVSDYQRFKAEQVTVTNPDFRVKARVMHSKLVYHDPLFTFKSKAASHAFYMPFEPDQHYVVGMYDLDHNGRFCKDGSGYGHHGRWQNNPALKQGIDRGFGASTYVDFDGKNIYGYVNDFPQLRLSTANYFSITCTIYPTDISATDGIGGTKFRTILNKPDTTWPDNTKQGQIDTGTVGNGYALAVTPDGKVRFTLAKNGIRYSVETLSGIITSSDPPFAYDITVTVDQVNKKTIPAEQVVSPVVPGGDPDAEPPFTPPLVAPRMEISVDNRFFQIYTTAHLSFVDDPTRRLRFGTTFHLPLSTRLLWHKWKGGIQQLRIYRDYLLTFSEIQNLYLNKQTIREMPIGAAAHAGSVLVFEDPSLLLGGYDPFVYDPGGFLLGSNEFGIYGFPGYDPLGFDNFGFDVAPITEQGLIQNGGFDPRGFSTQGFHTIPTSQS
jgi:hypothetical protein